MKKFQEVESLARKLQALGHENLSKIFCFVHFKNDSSDLDHQSVVFNQCQNDLKTFCSYIASEKVKDEDLEILVDCLISLLGVGNKQLRKLIEGTFREFMPLLKSEVIELVVSEIFTPLELTENLLIDETVESESDVDLDEKEDIEI